MVFSCTTTLNILIALILMIAGHTAPADSVLHQIAYSVYIPMLYFWFAAVFEHQHAKYLNKIVHMLLYVLIPAAATVFLLNCITFFSSDGQSFYTFGEQMQYFGQQMFWANGGAIGDHPALGYPWFLISLCWCVLFYGFMKIICRPAWIRILSSLCVCIVGMILSASGILLPLSLDVSLVGLFFYTFGADSTSLLKQEKFPKKLPGILIILAEIVFAAFMFFAWLFFCLRMKLAIDIATRYYTNLLTITGALCGIMAIAAVTNLLARIFARAADYLPLWLSDYRWPVYAICLHTMDYMTTTWWNHRNWGMQLVLRCIMLFLSLEILFFITYRLTEIISHNRITVEYAAKDHGYLIFLVKSLHNCFPKVSSVIFHTIFAILFLMPTIQTTMLLSLDLNWQILVKIYEIAIILVSLYAVNELTSACDDKRFIAFVIIPAAGFLYWRSSNNYYMFVLALLIVAMSGRPIKKVLYIALTITIVVLLTAYFASMNGYIPYLVYSDNGHALGTVYRTDLMAHWFYILLIWAVLRNGMFTWFEYPLMFAFTIYMYHLTQGLAGYICMLLFLTICFIHQFIASVIVQKKRVRKSPDLLPVIISLAYPAGVFISLISTIFFSTFFESHSAGKLSSILARIQLSKEALVKYPITLFGQNIPEQGAGSIPDPNKDYFFIDNSFIRILMISGLIMLAVILFCETRLLLRAYESENIILVLALITIVLHSLIEHHLSEFWYNIFLTLPYASLAPVKKKRQVTGSLQTQR